ncbi:hypothetical protein RDV89_00535 [Nocardioides zeae]|uniref:Lipoprotein n=1 Tax=Nocardioides imazamoxiresistens TaxID=3231893 RepID=A0ABU3PQN9_9ACTN|nr:hypothetical protein [Nocardioides zeae]MDT9591532.1 hypothetical protein [Nocardioides zeae]
MFRAPRPVALAALATSAILALTACASGEDPEAETGSSPSSSEPTPSSPGSSGPATVDPTGPALTESPAEDGAAPVDPEDYDEVVAAAVADLATTRDVAEDEVTVLADAAVQWRNGALGCPEAGQFYTEAITPGRRVILEVDGEQYAYHGAETGPVTYCASPEEPATE